MITKIVNLLAGLFTIITGTIQILPDKYKNEPLKNVPNFIFPLFAVLTTFWFIYHFYVQKKLKAAGVSGEPIKFNYYIKRFNPFLLLQFTQDLHTFHHQLCEAKLAIKTLNLNSPTQKEAKELTALLLQNCQSILQKTLGEDFSLNIKFFEQKTNSSANKLSEIRNAVLVTYERVPSNKELQNTLVHKIKKRTNTEKFVISKWEPDKIEKLYSIIDAYKGKYKKNLAYDYVFSANNHFWLSNNLEKDSEKKYLKAQVQTI